MEAEGFAAEGFDFYLQATGAIIFTGSILLANLQICQLSYEFSIASVFILLGSVAFYFFNFWAISKYLIT